MTETSLFWGGTTVGDHGRYTDDQFSDFIRKLFQTDRTVEGVISDYLNELAITNPAGVTIRVTSGGALVDGKLYESDANVDHTIAAPGAGTNYYTIVLRKSFAAQTVRQVLLGPNAVAYPTVTQTDGTTWEIEIARISITSASVISITDQRNFCHYPSQLSAGMIPNGLITNDMIDSVAWAKITGVTPSGATSKGIFPELSAVAPLSGVQAAGLSVIESSGAGTAKPVIPIISFDDTTDEGRQFEFNMPSEFTGTLHVKIAYYMAGANVSKTVAWNAQIAAISDTDASVTAKVFGATNQSVVTCPDTAGVEDVASITMINADSVSANDSCILHVWRDVSNDDAAGDAIITGIWIYWA